ncbi:hypothetical protein I4U23_001331 [Adineta vaga]|nr:hypothetical protein I4U23_001331 [Adineta vaga]
MDVKCLLIMFILVTICSPRSVYDRLVQDGLINKRTNFLLRSFNKVRKDGECDSENGCTYNHYIHRMKQSKRASPEYSRRDHLFTI